MLDGKREMELWTVMVKDNAPIQVLSPNDLQILYSSELIQQMDMMRRN